MDRDREDNPGIELVADRARGFGACLRLEPGNQNDILTLLRSVLRSSDLHSLARATHPQQTPCSTIQRSRHRHVVAERVLVRA